LPLGRRLPYQPTKVEYDNKSRTGVEKKLRTDFYTKLRSSIRRKSSLKSHKNGIEDASVNKMNGVSSTPSLPPQNYKRQSIDFTHHPLKSVVEDQASSNDNIEWRGNNMTQSLFVTTEQIANSDEELLQWLEEEEKVEPRTDFVELNEKKRNGHESVFCSTQKPKPLPRRFNSQTKPVAAQRSLFYDNNRPVAPPRQCSGVEADICPDTTGLKGVISEHVETSQNETVEPKNVSNLVDEDFLEQQPSTSKEVSDRHKRPEVPPPPIEVEHRITQVNPLRLVPGRSSVKRQLKSVLTPPLPRPLIQPPPLPPKARASETVNPESR
jgi:hypothetical protein